MESFKEFYKSSCESLKESHKLSREILKGLQQLEGQPKHMIEAYWNATENNRRKLCHTLMSNYIYHEYNRILQKATSE